MNWDKIEKEAIRAVVWSAVLVGLVLGFNWTVDWAFRTFG